MIHINYSDKDEMLVGQYTVCQAVNHIIEVKSYGEQLRINIVFVNSKQIDVLVHDLNWNLNILIKPMWVGIYCLQWICALIVCMSTVCSDFRYVRFFVHYQIHL